MLDIGMEHAINSATMKEPTEIKEVKVAVLSPEVVRLQEIGKDILDSTKEFALQVRSSANTLAEKYLNLCRHIRKNQIPPKVVSTELKALGFAKQRITEVNRVAQCADELWKEVDAKRIGFRGALEEARADITKLENVNPAIDINEPQDLKTGTWNPEATPEDEEKARLTAMDRCAKTIINGGEFLNLRGKTWRLNGYTLKLAKDKKSPSKDSRDGGGAVD